MVTMSQWLFLFRLMEEANLLLTLADFKKMTLVGFKKVIQTVSFVSNLLNEFVSCCNGLLNEQIMNKSSNVHWFCHVCLAILWCMVQLVTLYESELKKENQIICNNYVANMTTRIAQKNCHILQAVSCSVSALSKLIINRFKRLDSFSKK